jgi:predicted DNA-binding transcriptional regulator AlpA
MTKFRAASASALLTTNEVAAKLGCSMRSIEQYRQKGIGPKFLKINGMIRYREEDVDAFLADAERASTKERRR